MPPLMAGIGERARDSGSRARCRRDRYARRAAASPSRLVRAAVNANPSSAMAMGVRGAHRGRRKSGAVLVVVIICAASVTAEIIQPARNASSPRLFSALKTGCRYWTASAIAPRETGSRGHRLRSRTGVRGIVHAQTGVCGGQSGICCCQLRMPTIPVCDRRAIRLDVSTVASTPRAHVRRRRVVARKRRLANPVATI